MHNHIGDFPHDIKYADVKLTSEGWRSRLCVGQSRSVLCHVLTIWAYKDIVPTCVLSILCGTKSTYSMDVMVSVHKPVAIYCSVPYKQRTDSTYPVFCVQCYNGSAITPNFTSVKLYWDLLEVGTCHRTELHVMVIHFSSIVSLIKQTKKKSYALLTFTKQIYLWKICFTMVWHTLMLLV